MLHIIFALTYVYNPLTYTFLLNHNISVDISLGSATYIGILYSFYIYRPIRPVLFKNSYYMCNIQAYRSKLQACIFKVTYNYTAYTEASKKLQSSIIIR